MNSYSLVWIWTFDQIQPLEALVQLLFNYFGPFLGLVCFITEDASKCDLAVKDVYLCPIIFAPPFLP